MASFKGKLIRLRLDMKIIYKIFGNLFGLMVLFFANGSVFAYNLSQNYPLLGMSPADGVDFFVYAINLLIALGALVAMLNLVWQGINIFMSGGNAGKVTLAKRKIKGIILGLFVLVSSFAMLTAINPELTKMKLPSFEDLVFKRTSPSNVDPTSPTVTYTEVPVGAVMESILNAVSTSPTQAYNYSSVKVETEGPSTEEICYLYDENGNAKDKNGDGEITELDEYQGLDFSICINELVKAIEHKLLYLNGGNYRCGTPGINDKDSPLGAPKISNWDAEPAKSWNNYTDLDLTDYATEGRTALNVNYHDWDQYNWTDLTNTPSFAEKFIPVTDRCRYWGNCEIDGVDGIINKLKEYQRNGCVCSETGARTTDLYNPDYVGCEGTAGGGALPEVTFYCKEKFGCGVDWCYDNCDPFIGCSGGPRGRNQASQSPDFNNIFDVTNPYYQHDPCLKRRSMDCMREFMNTIIYGDKNTKADCAAQENKIPPRGPIEMGWQCGDFENSGDAEIIGAKKTEFLLAYFQRLVSFKRYYRYRVMDLQNIEKFLMKDRRLETYSRAEFQELQQAKKEAYVFDQNEIELSQTFETTAYRRRFNCSLYENSEELNKKNVYEDDEYRKNMFTCAWGEDKYYQTQKDNRLITIKTGDFISNLHVDRSMDLTGPNSQELENTPEDTRLCARGELATLKDDSTFFNNVESECNSILNKIPKLEGPQMSQKRFVQWSDDIYKKAGFSYKKGADDESRYYTGEDMAIDGDSLTFYVLKDPNNAVDKFYTGRDKVPYYFKTAFIDYSQYSENSAIDTEVGAERGFLLPSLVPVGQLSYHTKIYAKQMIRTIDRTLDQVKAAIIALDNISNVYTEGYYKGISNIDRGLSDISYNESSPGALDNSGEYSPGCDCVNCENSSDCTCVEWDEACGCIHMWCTNTCSACESKSQSVCATCSKVLRYTKFITSTYDKYYSNFAHVNPEPMADDVIKDDLPESIKFIVHDMNCPGAEKTAKEGACSCNKATETYSPPSGFTVTECNAWDRDLKEERPCIDHKNDIVVYLTGTTYISDPAKKCACGYSKSCQNGKAVDIRTNSSGNVTTYLWNCECDDGTEVNGCKYSFPNYGKPVIYLYPEEIINVRVKVEFDGEIIEDEPKYKDGWNVKAYPNGKLVNIEDDKEYEYLYWEGNTKKEINYDLSEGFVIAGEKTEEFLKGKLKEIGLNQSESNEFIEYWEPLMKTSKYNLIHFSRAQYTDNVKLDVIPKPDSVLRVFMVYRPLNDYMEIRPQVFDKFERKGFTVVEWGGTIAKENYYECLINNKTILNDCKI